MGSNISIALGALSLFVVWRLLGYLQDRRANPDRLPLPPGPKGYPVIGSLLDFPTEKPWLVYDKWFQIYGDMIYFEVLGQPFFILGKFEIAHELFEKRSPFYSDRPRMPMLLELMDSGYNLGFLPYGDWWRRHRRAFHAYFNVNTVMNYRPNQLKATRVFLRRLLLSPERLVYHIRHMFASTIVLASYGIQVKDEGDPHVQNVYEALQGLAEAGQPGTFLVDLIPAMKCIPSWFPGAGWKRKADRWKCINGLILSEPFEHVKNQLKEGTAVPSIASSMIEKLPAEGAPDYLTEEKIAQNICAMAFTGGADSTMSTVLTFFMAMVLYSDVQKKAQAELDTVLGGKLPEFNDRPSLPYINATIREALRWQPVAPLAAPHMSNVADEYNGYYIPKGTIVLGNSWSFLHNPEAFKDPHVYNPERFLKDGKIDHKVRDPYIAAFGYGRRVCPGRYFSDDSIFSVVAHVLSIFNILPGLDENGKEIIFEPEMTNGLLSYPVPFQYRLVPRSKMAEELVKNSELMD